MLQHILQKKVYYLIVESHKNYSLLEAGVYLACS